jgi:hypothetical protein
MYAERASAVQLAELDVRRGMAFGAWTLAGGEVAAAAPTPLVVVAGSASSPDE